MQASSVSVADKVTDRYWLSWTRARVFQVRMNFTTDEVAALLSTMVDCCVQVASAYRSSSGRQGLIRSCYFFSSHVVCTLNQAEVGC